jgi:hypothetical protein
MHHELRVPIGIDDFRMLREQRLTYVDKSQLIPEILDKAGTQVLLLPRPRRFGKTLNLSMLRAFFEKRDEDLSSLFEDLRVWQAGELYRAHFQRYPVIYLNLKDIKFSSFETCWGALKEKIQALFDEHRALLDTGALTEREAANFRALLGGTASIPVYTAALADLSSYLHAAHGERVVILIDEYDTPIHAAYVHGYHAQLLDLFRALLSGGLKGNAHLFKAVLTGILRVARESIFSGLNNLGVFSLLRADFNTCFGFTEAEVQDLLEKAGRSDRLEPLRAWYNGYIFGGEVIYNPWSVLNFLAAHEAEPEPYWLSTSSNDLVRELLQQRALEVQPVFEGLLEGGSIERVLEENVSLGELSTSEDALWSLLVFSGYLRAERRSRGPMERPAHLLSIPNREVRQLYTSTFRSWMAAGLRARGGELEALLSALLAGDAEGLARQLEAFVENALSYHDIPLRAPEQVYQAFIVGLLAALEGRYEVRSNRETGRGRADVLISPREAGRPGVVLELKTVKLSRQRPEKALAEGIAQIRAKHYAAALRAAGAAPVHLFAVAFDGKRVWVRGAEAEAEAPERGGARRVKQKGTKGKTAKRATAVKKGRAASRSISMKR